MGDQGAAEELVAVCRQLDYLNTTYAVTGGALGELCRRAEPWLVQLGAEIGGGPTPLVRCVTWANGCLAGDESWELDAEVLAALDRLCPEGQGAEEDDTQDDASGAMALLRAVTRLLAERDPDAGGRAKRHTRLCDLLSEWASVRPWEKMRQLGEVMERHRPTYLRLDTEAAPNAFAFANRFRLAEHDRHELWCSSDDLVDLVREFYPRLTAGLGPVVEPDGDPLPPVERARQVWNVREAVLAEIAAEAVPAAGGGQGGQGGAGVAPVDLPAGGGADQADAAPALGEHQADGPHQEAPRFGEIFLQVLKTHPDLDRAASAVSAWGAGIAAVVKAAGLDKLPLMVGPGGALANLPALIEAAERGELPEELRKDVEELRDLQDQLDRVQQAERERWAAVAREAAARLQAAEEELRSLGFDRDFLGGTWLERYVALARALGIDPDPLTAREIHQALKARLALVAAEERARRGVAEAPEASHDPADSPPWAVGAPVAILEPVPFPDPRLDYLDEVERAVLGWLATMPGGHGKPGYRRDIIAAQDLYECCARMDQAGRYQGVLALFIELGFVAWDHSWNAPELAISPRVVLANRHVRARAEAARQGAAEQARAGVGLPPVSTSELLMAFQAAVRNAAAPPGRDVRPADAGETGGEDPVTPAADQGGGLGGEAEAAGGSGGGVELLAPTPAPPREVVVDPERLAGILAWARDKGLRGKALAVIESVVDAGGVVGIGELAVKVGWRESIPPKLAALRNPFTSVAGELKEDGIEALGVRLGTWENNAVFKVLPKRRRGGRRRPT